VTHTSPDFRWPVRVYWEDTDAGGIVFYANYLKYFERARTEWLRSLGHAQEAMRANDGVMFIVTDTSVRYRRPARLDDVLDVTVRVQHAGRAQLTVAQQAWRGTELVAEGSIRIGCVDAGTYRPQRIPMSITRSIPQSPPG